MEMINTNFQRYIYIQRKLINNILISQVQQVQNVAIENLQEKKERIIYLNQVQDEIALAKHNSHIGTTQRVLVEEDKTKRSDDEVVTRNDGNTVVIVPKGDYKVGDFLDVTISEATRNILKAKEIVKKI